jgi:hypothetical protein
MHIGPIDIDPADTLPLTMSGDIVEQGVRFVLKPEGEGKKLMKKLIMILLTPS